MSTFHSLQLHNHRAGPVGPIPVENVQGTGLALGPLVAESLFPEPVPLNYLITKEPIPICHPKFTDPLNWEGKGSYMCFPSVTKSDMNEWLEIWEERFEDRFRKQGILRFFKLSLATKCCDPRVYSALMAFWNSSTNCFYFSEDPMSINLADVKILSRCKVNGVHVHQYSQEGDINPKGTLQVMDLVEKHLNIVKKDLLTIWALKKRLNFSVLG